MWNFSEQLRFVIKVFCSNNKTKEYIFQAFDGLKENRKRNYHKMGYNVETFAYLAKKKPDLRDVINGRNCCCHAPCSLLLF